MLEHVYHVTLSFIEPLLGTVPKNPEVYAAYIAGKAALTEEQLAEELAGVQSVEEQGWTGFMTDESGRPYLLDYVVKGFFKDACSMLRRVPGSQSSKLSAYKKVIDGLVFVEPRKIYIDLAGDLTVVERPLRAQTAQGERVALARSDAAPAGSMIEFDVRVLGSSVSTALLEEWLAYGRRRGLGQWRNSGAGAFEAQVEE